MCYNFGKKVVPPSSKMKKQQFIIPMALCLMLTLAACQSPTTVALATQTPRADTAVPARPTRTQAPAATWVQPVQQTDTQAAPGVEQTEKDAFYSTSIAIVRAIQATVTPHVSQYLPSPNGKWQAQVITYDCAQIDPDSGMPNSYEILKISHWTVATQLLFCGGIGSGGLAGRFWSASSRFFYYTYAREGWPEGGGPWRPPLSRFDTTTAQSDTLDLAIQSPDQQKIAGAQGTDLVIWETNSDTVARFPGPIQGNAQDTAWVSWVDWSPDGTKLAYLMVHCQEIHPCPSTLTLVDLNSQTQTQLLGESDPTIIQVDWQQPDQLKLTGVDYLTTYTYNLKDRSLTNAPTSTVTPTPR